MNNLPCRLLQYSDTEQCATCHRLFDYGDWSPRGCPRRARPTWRDIYPWVIVALVCLGIGLQAMTAGYIVMGSMFFVGVPLIGLVAYKELRYWYPFW